MKICTLLALFLAVSDFVFPNMSRAESGTWCLVADGRHSIPLSTVRCLVASDTSDAMTVVTDEGSIPDIYNVKFSFIEQSSVTAPSLPVGDAPTFISCRDEIRIFGLADGSKITIHSADGRLVDTCPADGSMSPVVVPISGLTPGLYIMKAGTASFKFIKA